MPTDPERSEAIGDAAEMIDAMRRGDWEWAETILHLGDSERMCWEVTGLLVRALNLAGDEAAEFALAEFRKSADWPDDSGEPPF